MEKVSVSVLKNHLSEYLRKVRAGHSIVIYDRNVPIARIERIEQNGTTADKLARLQADGLVRPARHPLSGKEIRALLDGPGVPLPGVLDALLREREEGR